MMWSASIPSFRFACGPIPTTASGPHGRGAGVVVGEFGALSRPERLALALEGGEKLHPGFRDKVFADNGVSIAWARMPYQDGGWANDTFLTQPELFERLGRASPVGRHVFLAGDWFSYWLGWQIGSLDSAHVATDAIARLALGRG